MELRGQMEKASYGMEEEMKNIIRAVLVFLGIVCVESPVALVFIGLAVVMSV